jgi:hypothetical protein
LENPVVFYSRRVAEIVLKAWRYWAVYRNCKAILKEVLAAPDRRTYSDLSIRPPREEEFDSFDLYQATSGGAAALARKRRDDVLRNKAMTVDPSIENAAIQSTN